MGTTRIKVIDLSGDQKEIKTSRKHAQKVSGLAKIKEEKKPKEAKKSAELDKKIEKGITESTEIKQEGTELIPTATPSVPSKPSVPSVVKTKSKISTRHLGKKYQAAAKLVDKTRNYPLAEAIALLTQTSFTHFDPTVELHLAVTDKNLRGSVNLPHTVQTKVQKRRYLIFTDKKPITENTEKGQKAQKSTRSVPSKSSVPSVITNRIIWGDEGIIADIESGKLKPKRDFDQVLSSPKFMPGLAKIAKILGPAGLMPNPKNDTLVDDPAMFLGAVGKDQFEFKTDPTAPIIHTKIGKLSDKPTNLEENFKALVAAVGPTKIRKAIIKSTMSPGIKLEISPTDWTLPQSPQKSRA